MRLEHFEPSRVGGATIQLKIIDLIGVTTVVAFGCLIWSRSQYQGWAFPNRCSIRGSNRPAAISPWMANFKMHRNINSRLYRNSIAGCSHVFSLAPTFHG